MGPPDGEPILPIYPMNRRASCHYIPPHKGVDDWQVVPLTATATPGTGRSRKQTVDHLTMDIRQTKIATCMAERKTLMIESQQV